jgi:membrane-associated phospholipid phosphatase
MTQPIRQDQSRIIRAWLAAAILCALLAALSIAFVDRPLTLLVHSLHGTQVLGRLSRFNELLIPVGVALFIPIAVVVALGYRRPVTMFVFRCGVALIVGTAVKDELKFLFGRTWPETWLRDNPSFVRDGVFGFWPLHGGYAYAAFPSGHTTAGFIVLSLLWQRWPRLRVLYALAGVALIAVLVGGGFHWLSDTIAGAFLGTAIGGVAASLGRAEATAITPPPAIDQPAPGTV